MKRPVLAANRGPLLRRARRFGTRMAQRLGSYPMYLIPPSRTVALHGESDEEENLLVVGLEMTRRTDHAVTLLAADVDRALHYLEVLGRAYPGTDRSRLRVRPRSVATAWWLQVRSELVITSHLHVHAARTRGRRLHAWVSHGMGVKNSYSPPSSEDVVATNTRLWMEQKLRNLQRRPHTVLVTGMPRQDVLRRPPADGREALRRLGLDPGRPVVVWAPTYRSTRMYGLGLSTEGTLEVAAGPTATDLGVAADRAGVQLLVKPHWMDAASYDAMGLRVVVNEDIWNAGLSPYQLLGLADGLISDYSSIWLDYLDLGRPIGLYCPDLDSFSNDRSTAVPGLEAVAGELLLRDQDDIGQFFGQVSHGESPEQLAAVREQLQYVEVRNRTSAFLDDLRDVGVARHGYGFGL